MADRWYLEGADEGQRGLAGAQGYHFAPGKQAKKTGKKKHQSEWCFFR
jgi:hypothetical protein